MGKVPGCVRSQGPGSDQDFGGPCLRLVRGGHRRRLQKGRSPDAGMFLRDLASLLVKLKKYVDSVRHGYFLGGVVV